MTFPRDWGGGLALVQVNSSICLSLKKSLAPYRVKRLWERSRNCCSHPNSAYRQSGNDFLWHRTQDWGGGRDEKKGRKKMWVPNTTWRKGRQRVDPDLVGLQGLSTPPPIKEQSLVTSATLPRCRSRGLLQLPAGSPASDHFL